MASAAKTAGLLILLVVLTNAYCNPTVSTPMGTIEGKQYEADRFTCDVFLGIPFAQPPIGNLRFEKPLPLNPDSDRKIIANSMPNRCTQTIEGRQDLFPIEPDSEDCLYLNVLKPSEQTNEPLPVMVFIHGGAFKSGSARQYGINGPCNNIVRKGVVLVIIQYRLGLFGFLSTDDSVSPGNQGLWDQIEALRWVQQNIASFGGDPNSVTIFGESAGAMSVSILSYSDLTQDLYHRSIQQSGSAVTPLALREHNVEGTKLLAEYACSLKEPTSQEIIDCLRSFTAEELYMKSLKLVDRDLRDPKAPAVPNGWDWFPCVDGHIIKHNAMNIYKGANSKPAIIGSNDNEIMWFVQPPPYMDEIVKHFPTHLSEDQITAELIVFVAAATIPPNVDQQTKQAIQKVIKHIYIDSHNAADNKTKLMEQYIKLLNDLWFNVPSSLDAQARKAKGASVYMYNFDYYCKNIFPEDFKYKSSQHSFELFHLFDMGFGKLSCGEFDANDKLISDKLATVFTNFAKHGTPNPTEPEWPEWVSIEEAYNYRFGLDSKVDGQFHSDTVVFWTQLFAKAMTHDEL